MKTKMHYILILVLLMASISVNSQNYDPKTYKLANVCLSAEEMKLYNSINEYRTSKGLSKIPLSRSLTYVAQLHCWDQNVNNPAQGACNMHSWSGKGTWQAVCYTPDHKNMHLMHSKPSELTKYEGDGFEISHAMFGSSKATAESALNGWKNSKGHNAVMINEGIWSDEWKAIGIGISGNYANVWFGNDADIEPIPLICK